MLWIGWWLKRLPHCRGAHDDDGFEDRASSQCGADDGLDRR